jgi:hypothetical protein
MGCTGMIIAAIVLSICVLCFFGCRKFNRDIHAMYAHCECPGEEGIDAAS